LEKKTLIVICCGLPKTGTKSLVKALKILGFKSEHYVHSSITSKLANKKDIFQKLDEGLEATAENAGIICYKEIYKRYPDSVFIYTKRDIESWLNSCKYHLTKRYPLKHKNVTKITLIVRDMTWGTIKYNKEKLIKQYKKQEREVLEFFKDKQDRFMIFETGIDGWEKLCGFLNKNIPERKYPQVNKK
jgi:hypothetical protein